MTRLYINKELHAQKRNACKAILKAAADRGWSNSQLAAVLGLHPSVPTCWTSDPTRVPATKIEVLWEVVHVLKNGGRCPVMGRSKQARAEVPPPGEEPKHKTLPFPAAPDTDCEELVEVVKLFLEAIPMAMLMAEVSRRVEGKK